MPPHVLQHEVRRAIVTLLRDGEMTAGALAEALRRARPGVSHHLSSLLDHGILVCRHQGANRHYSLDLAKALAAWDAYLAGAGDGDA